MKAVTRFAVLIEPVRAPADAHALDDLARELDTLFAGRTRAAFVRRASSVCGILDGDAKPFEAVVLGCLSSSLPPLRYVVVARKPPTMDDALAADGETELERLRRAGDRAGVGTGSGSVDALLDDLLAGFIDQLEDLTERQKTIARLAILEGQRQSQVAAKLGIQRATASIAFERAHVRSLVRSLSALDTLLRGVT